MRLRFTNAHGAVFDFLADGVILKEVAGAESAAVESILRSLPFRHGGSSVRRHLPARYITIGFNLTGGSEGYLAMRSEALETLSPALSEGTLEFQPKTGGQIYQIDGSVSQLAVPFTSEHFAQDCAVEFECPFPFWRGELNSQTINVSTTASATITNAGNVAVYPRVTIAENQAVQFGTPLWRNVTHGGIMSLTGLSNIGTSQYIVADHHEGTVERLQAPFSLISMLAVTSHFWALEPGEQTVQCQKSGGTSVGFVFEWHDLYTGV